MFQRCQKPTLSVQVPKEILNGLSNFSNCARSLDTNFHVESSAVALVIGNNPAHPNVDNLKIIELVF